MMGELQAFLQNEVENLPSNLNQAKFWNIWALTSLYRAKTASRSYEILLGGWGLDTTTPSRFQSAKAILEKDIAPAVHGFLDRASEHFQDRFQCQRAEYYAGGNTFALTRYGLQPGIKLVFSSREDGDTFLGAFKVEISSHASRINAREPF